MWVGEEGIHGWRAYKYRNDPFHDIQPLPSGVAALPSETVQDTRGDQVAKGARDERPGVEDGHAEGQLLLGVPLGQVEQDTRKEGCFHETQDESARNDFPGRFHLASNSRNQTPDAGLKGYRKSELVPKVCVGL